MTVDSRNAERSSDLGGPDDAIVRPPEERPRHRASGRHLATLRRRPFVFAMALLFFFGPAVAFGLGARPTEFENRKLTEFPSLSDGWKFFPDFTSWAIDHLPLRQQAVQANAAVSEGVFGEPPSTREQTGGGPVAGVPSGRSTTAGSQKVDYPQVIQGRNGWLYYGADVSNLCQPARTIQQTMDRLNRLAEAVDASGRRFVLVIAPDKSTVYPQDLPKTYLGEKCAAERRDAFWTAVHEHPPLGYVDLRDDLVAEQKRTGPIYRPTDTHWAPRGAAIYAWDLARALDPALLNGTQVVPTGTAQRQGDLGRLIGQPHLDTFDDVAIARTGVSPVGRPSLDLPDPPLTGPVSVTNESTGAPLFEPRTLLLGDSFTASSRATLGPFFADLDLLHNETGDNDPQIVASAMVDADVVVLEIVERNIASGRGSIINYDTLSLIEGTLRTHPR